MFKFIKRRIRNNKGAMENILVTLLFVIIGVGALVGLSTWINSEEDNLKTTSSSKVESVTTDISK